MEAMLAANGDAEKLSDWNAMVENIKSAVEQTQSILNDNGHGDVIYIMQVANDLSANHENVLLSVSMGMVFYDYVNGIDLL